MYFISIGIFSLMMVAQFWGFANDLYTKDEGERLFPIIGFGASIGAVLVFVGTTYFALGGGGFAKLNIVIVAGWLVLAFFVGREYTRLARTGSQPGSRLVGAREETAPALTVSVLGHRMSRT